MQQTSGYFGFGEFLSNGFPLMSIEEDKGQLILNNQGGGINIIIIIRNLLTSFI